MADVKEQLKVSRGDESLTHPWKLFWKKRKERKRESELCWFAYAVSCKQSPWKSVLILHDHSVLVVNKRYHRMTEPHDLFCSPATSSSGRKPCWWCLTTRVFLTTCVLTSSTSTSRNFSITGAIMVSLLSWCVLTSSTLTSRNSSITGPIMVSLLSWCVVTLSTLTSKSSSVTGAIMVSLLSSYALTSSTLTSRSSSITGAIMVSLWSWCVLTSSTLTSRNSSVTGPIMVSLSQVCCHGVYWHYPPWWDEAVLSAG